MSKVCGCHFFCCFSCGAWMETHEKDDGVSAMTATVEALVEELRGEELRHEIGRRVAEGRRLFRILRSREPHFLRDNPLLIRFFKETDATLLRLLRLSDGQAPEDDENARQRRNEDYQEAVACLFGKHDGRPCPLESCRPGVRAVCRQVRPGQKTGGNA